MISPDEQKHACAGDPGAVLDGGKSLTRGTAILIISQGCYFVLGYLAVVLMAREFGPAAYGAYGVVMSVLVWLEESGRFAVPSATAKLVAETAVPSAALERAALTLNLAIYSLLFLCMWTLAPLLETWFGIQNGALLFRIAALDLPAFGAYTIYRAIHQGRGRFLQLGCSQVIYAAAKLLGIVLLITFGLTLENALLVNVAATLLGLACLIPGARLGWAGGWVGHAVPLLSSATPMGLYYFVLLLRDWLVLWVLQVMYPAATVIGVFLAAYNIARVPALILTTVTTVVLPSVSRAIAFYDERLAKQHIDRSLRFCLILYVPVCLVFLAEPEKLMQFVYSKDFFGGGLILSLLIIAEGLHVFHAILGTALMAAGQARKAAIVAMASLLPALGILILGVRLWEGPGAAFSHTLTILLSGAVLLVLVMRRFGMPMNSQSVINIGLATFVMIMFFIALSMVKVFFLVSCAVAISVYFAVLLARGEITREELAAFLPWIRVRSSPNRL